MWLGTDVSVPEDDTELLVLGCDELPPCGLWELEPLPKKPLGRPPNLRFALISSM